MIKENNQDNEAILAQYLAQQIADIRNKKGHNGLTITLQEWKARKRIMLEHRGFAEQLLLDIAKDKDR